MDYFNCGFPMRQDYHDAHEWHCQNCRDIHHEIEAWLQAQVLGYDGKPPTRIGFNDENDRSKNT